MELIAICTTTASAALPDVAGELALALAGTRRAFVVRLAGVPASRHGETLARAIARHPGYDVGLIDCPGERLDAGATALAAASAVLVVFQPGFAGLRCLADVFRRLADQALMRNPGLALLGALPVDTGDPTSALALKLAAEAIGPEALLPAVPPTVAGSAAIATLADILDSHLECGRAGLPVY